MTIKRHLLFIFLLTIFYTITWDASAQQSLTQDYSYVMKIPSVVTMESSPAHLYVLSDREGMILFRTHPDSLQWLYSSAGMEQRGYKMTADIRFAYLFGDSNRLTVLEPTSVLGVYSSTNLPSQPLDAKRLGQFLYVAMGDEGLGRLDLSSPASVDSTMIHFESQRLQNERVVDLESSLSQLFALTSSGHLLIFTKDDDEIALSNELDLRENLEHIFVIGEQILGSNSSGQIFEISGNGNLAEIGSIGEPVQKIEVWNDWLIIKGTSNRLWTSYLNRAPTLWKKDGEAGNFFTVTQNQFWLCEYGQISRVTTTSQSATTVNSTAEQQNTTLRLKPIPNVTTPFSKPVLQAIELEGNYPLANVQFSYQSNIQNAQIRGNGFYWQPQSGDICRYLVKIIATAADGQTDSTSFSVDVRSFNAPPRFSPIRTMTIPVGEPFTLPIRATDPDGTNPNLIRYIGVDLPQSARINEQNGQFTWTPTARQVGENSFQVIATDQYGAASQMDITIRVVEVTRSEGSELGD